MTGRRIATAAVLVSLFAFSLQAQVTARVTAQALSQPTPQTRQQLTKALQEARANKDAHAEAVTLVQLGIVEATLGDIDSGLRNLADAAAKLRAQNDGIGEWMALLFAIQVEAATGRTAQALVHAEKAMALVEEAKASTAPFSFKTLAAFGAVSGLPPQMLAMVDDSNAAMMKPVMLQIFLEPVTRDLYGSALTQAGQFEKAEKELKAAAAGSVKSQGMYDFSIEMHFGDLRFRQERHDDARMHYMKALTAATKAARLAPGAEQIKAGIYARLAGLESTVGRTEEAKRWAEKARELTANGTARR